MELLAANQHNEVLLRPVPYGARSMGRHLTCPAASDRLNLPL
jgi:hypothetical protein